MDRGNDKISVRFSPEIHYRLEQQAKASRKTKTEIVREAVEQHLFGEEWLSKCDAVLKTSIIQVQESHRALEARIHRLVDEGVIDFEVQTINAEIAKLEERIQKNTNESIGRLFTHTLERLPALVVHWNANGAAAAKEQVELMRAEFLKKHPQQPTQK